MRATQANQKMAEVIAESSTRIEQLMSGLQCFVSLDASDEKVVDVCKGLDAALTVLRPPERITIERDYSLGGASVRCFPARLNQVFLNLLQNAEQSIKGYGRIRIEVRVRAELAEVVIQDTGVGIPKAILPRVFDFGFVPKVGGRVGLRLGLPSSKRSIEEIGGEITLSSDVGAGTRVTLRLPCSQIGSVPKAGVMSVVDPHRRGRPRQG
jgi:signal transduction histidine kinase